MAILAASMTVPVVAIRQKPDIISISVRRPGVEFVQRCHRRVNIWSLFLAQQIFHVVLLAISYVLLRDRCRTRERLPHGRLLPPIIRSPPEKGFVQPVGL